MTILKSICLFLLLVIDLSSTLPFRPAIRPPVRNPAILSGVALANQYGNNGASSDYLLLLWIILGIIIGPIVLFFLCIGLCILKHYVDILCCFLHQKISDCRSKINFCCGFCKKKDEMKILKAQNKTVPDDVNTQIQLETHTTMEKPISRL